MSQSSQTTSAFQSSQLVLRDAFSVSATQFSGDSQEISQDTQYSTNTIPESNDTVLELISPELNRPLGTQPATQPTSPTPDPVWNEWAKILFHSSLGPLRIPACHLNIPDFASYRTHSDDACLEMAKAMQDDNRRYLYPILVELAPGIIDEDTFRQYIDVGINDEFPAHLLEKGKIVAGVIHGHKRVRAAWKLRNLAEEEAYLYAKVVPSGISIFTKLLFRTFQKYQAVIDAWVMMENTRPMQSSVSPMEIIRTASRHLRRLPAILELRGQSGKAYKTQFLDFRTVLAAMLVAPSENGGKESLRGAREMAKRPHLVQYLEYLDRSSLFKEEWTARAFRKFSQWDPTIFEAVVGQMFMQFRVMSADCPESVTPAKIYHPIIRHSSALTVTKKIPKTMCTVKHFEAQLGPAQLDGVWEEWRLDGESFTDYMRRIQTVDIRDSDPVNNMISAKTQKYCFAQVLPLPSTFHDSDFCDSMTGVTTAMRRVIAFTNGPDAYRMLISYKLLAANVHTYQEIWDASNFVEGLIRGTINECSGSPWKTNSILTDEMKKSTQGEFCRMLRYLFVWADDMNTAWSLVMRTVDKSNAKSTANPEKFIPTSDATALIALQALLYDTHWSTIFFRLGIRCKHSFPRHKELVFQCLDPSTASAKLALKAGLTRICDHKANRASLYTSIEVDPEETALTVTASMSKQLKPSQGTSEMHHNDGSASEVPFSDWSQSEPNGGKGKAKANTKSPKKLKWNRIESSVEPEDDDNNLNPSAVHTPPMAMSPSSVTKTLPTQVNIIANRKDLDLPNTNRILIDSPSPSRSFLYPSVLGGEKTQSKDDGDALENLQANKRNTDDGESEVDKDNADNEKETVPPGSKRKRTTKPRNPKPRKQPKSRSVVSDSSDVPSPTTPLSDDNGVLGDMMETYNVKTLYGLIMKASTSIRVWDTEPDSSGNSTSSLDAYDVPAVAHLISRIISDPVIRKAAQGPIFSTNATNVLHLLAKDEDEDKSHEDRMQEGLEYDREWHSLIDGQDHPTSSEAIASATKKLEQIWNKSVGDSVDGSTWTKPVLQGGSQDAQPIEENTKRKKVDGNDDIHKDADYPMAQGSEDVDMETGSDTDGDE